MSRRLLYFLLSLLLSRFLKGSRHYCPEDYYVFVVVIVVVVFESRHNYPDDYCVVFVILFVVAVFVAIVVAWAETSFIPTASSSSLELFNLKKIIHM